MPQRSMANANENGINAIRGAFTHAYKDEKRDKNKTTAAARTTKTTLSQYNKKPLSIQCLELFFCRFFLHLNKEKKTKRWKKNCCKMNNTPSKKECTNQAKRERIGRRFLFSMGCFGCCSC